MNVAGQERDGRDPAEVRVRPERLAAQYGGTLRGYAPRYERQDTGTAAGGREEGPAGGDRQVADLDFLGPAHSPLHATSDFVGTQATFTQAPPIISRSTRTTR
jgi:hypothetical protein